LNRGKKAQELAGGRPKIFSQTLLWALYKRIVSQVYVKGCRFLGKDRERETSTTWAFNVRCCPNKPPHPSPLKGGEEEGGGGKGEGGHV